MAVNETGTFEDLFRRLLSVNAELDARQHEAAAVRKRLARTKAPEDASLRRRVLTRHEVKIRQLETEAGDLGARIDAMRREFPELPPIDHDDTVQLDVVRGRLASKRLEAGRMQALLTIASDGGVGQGVRAHRANRLRETAEEIKYYEGLIRRLEAGFEIDGRVDE